MKPLLAKRVLRVAAAIFLVSTWLNWVFADSSHLVPVDPNFETGAGAEYRRLYETKLFVTGGDVARYIHLPGPIMEIESVVSVDRQRANDRTARENYTVTVTRPSVRLWSCIATGEEKVTGRKVVDATSVTVVTHTAELPASTAETLHELWINMLQRAKPEACNECIKEGTTELFSARDSESKVLRAELPANPSRNIADLLQIANSLMDYCDVRETERVAAARAISERASDLLRRITAHQKTK